MLADVAAVNGRATVIRAESPVTLQDGPTLEGKRVLVVEDGPTLTHGGMAVRRRHRRGEVRQAPPSSWIRAPIAVGSIAEVYERYPHIGPVLPAMGYSDEQLDELRRTIDAADADVVVTGTPIDLGRLIATRHPDPPCDVRAAGARDAHARRRAGAPRAARPDGLNLHDRLKEDTMRATLPTTVPSDFLKVSDLDADQLAALLDLAAQMKERPHGFVEALRGDTVVCFFEQPSTRTRVSFAAAAERLGMLPLLLRPDELQLGRGEPLGDTARVLSGYAAAIVVRTFAQATRRADRLRGDRPGDQRAHERAPPVPGARRPAHAARALREAGRAAARLRGRRQQRRQLPRRGRSARRAWTSSSPRRPATGRRSPVRTSSRTRTRRSGRGRRLHRRLDLDGRRGRDRRPPARPRGLPRGRSAAGGREGPRRSSSTACPRTAARR